MKKQFLINGIFIFILSSCTSLIYSPSLGLSGKKLKEKQIDVSGGGGLLPETRPQVSQNSTSLGGYLNIGYGFSNNFNLSVSGWTDLKQNYNVSRSGYALQSRISFGGDSSKHFEIIPRIALLFYEKTQSGCGMEIAFVYMNNRNNKCFVYYGAGPVAGTMNFQKTKDANNQNFVYPSGFGVIGHFGIGFNIIPGLRTVIEINPIFEYNQYDGQGSYLIVPTISAGYIFK